MERTDTALLLVRIAFGLSMSWHGVNKVRSGIAGTAGWFGSIGMRWPGAQARVAAATEIAAGLLLAAGLLTGAASAAFIALMLVAIVTVHWKVGYFIFLPNGGWEYCASIAVVGAAIAIAGPGAASLDRAWSVRWMSGPSWIVIGVCAAVCHLALSWRPSSSSTAA